MKTRLAALVLILLPCQAFATPSSTFWTPMTLDIQPYGLLHVGVDNYFTVGHKLDDGAGRADVWKRHRISAAIVMIHPRRNAAKVLRARMRKRCEPPLSA